MLLDPLEALSEFAREHVLLVGTTGPVNGRPYNPRTVKALRSDLLELQTLRHTVDQGIDVALFLETLFRAATCLVGNQPFLI